MNKIEQHIIDLLQADDKKAMELIYDKYAPSLYGIVFRIVGTQELAEDVLQDSFVKIWTNRKRFERGKGSLFTWLLNITRNKAIDVTRSAHFKKSKNIQGINNFVSNNNNHSEEMNVEHIGLRKVVDDLDPKYKKIIDLIYFQGYTQREVEEHLDIPLGTVKSRVRIALRELRKVFGGVMVNWLILYLFFTFL